MTYLPDYHVITADSMVEVLFQLQEYLLDHSFNVCDVEIGSGVVLLCPEGDGCCGTDTYHYAYVKRSSKLQKLEEGLNA